MVAGVTNAGRGGATARLWVLSDLHLERLLEPDRFAPRPPPFDALVCAGDVWGRDPARGMAALRRLASDAPVVLVAGNHEAWGRTLPEAAAVMAREAARLGIDWLEDGEATVAGLRFLGSTLWTDQALAPMAVADGEPTGDRVGVATEDGFRPLDVDDARALHAASRAWLAGRLAVPAAGPTVVVTHHAAHPRSLPPGVAGTAAAGEAASDLSDLAEAGLAALWVHGHLHHSVDVRLPGGTRLLCNPGGARLSNPGFDPTLVVEVATGAP